MLYFRWVIALALILPYNGHSELPAPRTTTPSPLPATAPTAAPIDAATTAINASIAVQNDAADYYPDSGLSPSLIELVSNNPIFQDMSLMDQLGYYFNLSEFLASSPSPYVRVEHSGNTSPSYGVQVPSSVAGVPNAAGLQAALSEKIPKGPAGGGGVLEVDYSNNDEGAVWLANLEADYSFFGSVAAERAATDTPLGEKDNIVAACRNTRPVTAQIQCVVTQIQTKFRGIRLPSGRPPVCRHYSNLAYYVFRGLGYSTTYRANSLRPTHAWIKANRYIIDALNNIVYLPTN